jgi:predicted transport protein
MLKLIDDNKKSLMSLNITITEETVEQYPNYNKGKLIDSSIKQSTKDVCVNYCPDKNIRDITGGNFCNVTYKCKNLMTEVEINNPSCNRCINHLVTR